jgi:hypothetical protein
MPKRDIDHADISISEYERGVKKIRKSNVTGTPTLLLEDRRTSNEISPALPSHMMSAYYRSMQPATSCTSNAIIPYIPPSTAILSSIIFRDLTKSKHENEDAEQHIPRDDGNDGLMDLDK